MPITRNRLLSIHTAAEQIRARAAQTKTQLLTVIAHHKTRRFAEAQASASPHAAALIMRDALESIERLIVDWQIAGEEAIEVLAQERANIRFSTPRGRANQSQTRAFRTQERANESRRASAIENSNPRKEYRDVEEIDFNEPISQSIFDSQARYLASKKAREENKS